MKAIRAKALISYLLLILTSIPLLAGNPDVFYYVNDDDNTLWQIDVSTGVSTQIGGLGVGGVEAIAYWPIPGNNILYAADGGDIGTLNLSTGAYTFLSEIDGGGSLNGENGPLTVNDVDGLSFDPFTGILWASERKGTNGSYDIIFQIDETTGTYVQDAFGPGVDYILIDGEGIYDDVDDIAISSTSGLMFAVSNNGSIDQLININKYTGAITVIGDLTFQDIEGLAFANNGKLYGTRGGGNDPNFYEVDPADASMTNGVTLGDNGGSPDTESLASLVADANTVSGTLFNDQNLNGIRDGEPGLAGVTINLYLDNNDNGALDAGDNLLQQVTTDALGRYNIYIATTAEVLITVDDSTLPTNYTLTTTNLQEASFTDNVNFAETDTGNNFGAGASTDSDGDGIMDFTEGIGDSDGDGVLDRDDLDSDNDGILDADEGTEDLDFDGIPRYLDLDSDNDGIPDAIEANGGAAPAGYSSASATITGAVGTNGMPDAAETSPDSGVSVLANGDQDNDGIEDYWDPDSDNDGIVDLVEVSGTDADGNGTIDSFLDANGDGLHDALLSSPLTVSNTDQSYESSNGLTELPNYLDLDSDNDGIDDTNEGYNTSTTGRPELIIDSDGDGIIDYWDTSLGGSPITPNDNDGDGVPDYADTDSDNDTISDFIEANDSNADGSADTAITGTDSNGNGIDDAFDNNCSSITTITTGRSDHAEEDTSDGSMYLTSSDLEILYDGVEQVVGLKYSGVNVPPSANILSAYIQFQTDETGGSGTVIVDIEGELSLTPADFSTATNDVSGRTPTSNVETWTISNDWTVVGESGADQRTVDITDIINELIGQGGWSSGDDMVFILTRNAGDGSTNYRTAENNPGLVIKYSGGLSFGCGTNVALPDSDSDLEYDFRDNDDDNDGILTSTETGDSNPANGTPDYLEAGTSCSATGPTISGNADAVIYTFNQDSGEPGTNALGAADGTGARMGDESDAILVLDMTDEVRFGEDVTVRLRSSGGGSADIRVRFSNDNVTYGPAIDLNFDNNGNYTDYNFTVNVSPGARYIKLIEILDSQETLRIDAVSYSFSDCAIDTDLDGILDSADDDSDNDGIPDSVEGVADSDGDGILDYLDLDSDNDGIPDAVEGNGGSLPANMTADGQFNVIYAQNNDGDGDGLMDDVDGTPLTNPDTDGDGVDDRVDLDSDGDGITDIIEAGGTDSDGDGRADSSTDADNDGLIDTFDASQYGTALAITSTDGDSLPDYLDIDADNDGIPDQREGQSTAAYTASAGTDDDGDGLDNSFDPVCQETIVGNADAVTLDNGVDNSSNAIGNDNSTFAELRGGDDMVLDLTDLVPSGSTIQIFVSGNDANTETGDIEQSTDALGTILTNLSTLSFNSDVATAVNYTLTADTRYLRFSNASDRYRVYSVYYSFNSTSACANPLGTPIALSDIDSDGTPDYLDSDSDNDGVTDLIEGNDANADGVADATVSGTDTDGDGLDDNFDNVSGPAAGNEAGSNVALQNTDGDSQANWRDLDDDADGWLSTVEDWDGNNDHSDDFTQGGSPVPDYLFLHDSDGDGVDNDTDQDQDNDGISDINEGGGINPNADADSDGIPNFADPDIAGFVDNNGDGINDNFDNDLDGIPNHFDLDSDNDGVPDAVEANGGTLPVGMEADGKFPVTAYLLLDLDNDGLIDTYDPDFGSELVNTDSDGDGVPNSSDLDSDNDGLPDALENGGGTLPANMTADGQFSAAYVSANDADGDGIADDVDPDNGGTAITPRSTDEDGLIDAFDRDSDNDGLTDTIESGGTDADGDGTLDGFVDVDGDGLNDAIDSSESGTALTLVTTDFDSVPDHLDIDSDNDGIPDNVEGQPTIGYTPPSGIDTDGDGIDDEYDTDNSGTAISLQDTDGDGINDYQDLDSDGDGVFDYIEGSDSNMDGSNDYTPNSSDSDGDGLTNRYDNVSGPAAGNSTGSQATLQNSDSDLILDWRDPDDDGDGIPTSNEDANANGNWGDDFTQGGSNPDYLHVDTDFDNDGVLDSADPDADNDGVPDADEGFGEDPSADADNDGTPNYLDPDFVHGTLGAFVDTNGDGVNDLFDSDLDGIPNHKDRDSDNDGISDLLEAGGTDADSDGIADNLTDTDGDGLLDIFDTDNGGTPLVLPDTDGDGLNDMYDVDSDGDGVPDLVENGLADSDGNGRLDGFIDADGDGYDDRYNPDSGGSPVTLADTDSDGVEDYLDPDSDNDGILDNVEAQTTAGYTTSASNDADRDGLDDSYDNDSGGTAISTVDTDGDGTPDYQDTDSDGDTIPDVIEGSDANSDGTADWDDNSDDVFDASEGNQDTDSDGLLDEFDPDQTGNTPGLQNTDSTGDNDYRDPDDDGDGINTLDEIGDAEPNGTDDYLETDTPVAGDLDGDGVPDASDDDDDNDGIPDSVEGTGDSDGDGITDDRDLDSDNDGIVDAIEANGGTLPANMTPEGRYSITYATNNDGDGDGLIDDVDGTPLANPDSDADGVDDRIDRDSDNDGIPDIVEAGGTDTDGNGEVDSSTDSDSDGIADAVDFSITPGSQLTPPNTDGDANPDYLDLDSDGDTIFDLVEEQRAPGDIDADNDGDVDGSTDADGDGILDAVDPDEGGFMSLPDDFDGDGLPDFQDLDSDGDGLSDATEGTMDTDGDGFQDFNDIDSDGDGISDNRDAQASTSYRAPFNLDDDNDGLDNRYDPDNGGTAITIVNTDGTGGADHLDTDADDDGVPDSIEGHDANQDGVADRTAVGQDLDRDGLDDAFDTVTAGTEGNATGTNAVVLNTDGAGLRDWQDTDDDNDGILTSAEDDNSNMDWSDDFTQDQDPNTIPDYLYNASSNPLPLDWISFKARFESGTVLLEWQTANEVDVSYFDIEHSIDGVSYQVIDQLEAYNNDEGINNYAYSHSSPIVGINYYRLKQVDFDGAFEFSITRAVSAVVNGITYDIYPNPTVGRFTVQANGIVSGQIELRDMAGRVLFEKSLAASSEVDLDLTTQEAGVYILTIKTFAGTIRRRIIKQ